MHSQRQLHLHHTLLELANPFSTALEYNTNLGTKRVLHVHGQEHPRNASFQAEISSQADVAVRQVAAPDLQRVATANELDYRRVDVTGHPEDV